MAWPTPQDYNEAVQNPRHAFSDSDLQSGKPETTVLGLPRPITGNFASVYRFYCGSRSWAVRCFWRERDDMQQRYAAISQHLKGAALPYTVQFEYQAEGIRIRGKWYPILKMEWQEGELLHEYLASHLADPGALTNLAEQWRCMAADLEMARTAHGDLQHGNVMVVQGCLKLVDYDGMYVPALKGMGSHELGLQHYQHPERSAKSFDEHLDRFAAWAIYVSILALARDPSLWQSTGAGDERLLFDWRDFRESESSSTFSRLVDSEDPEVKAAALILRRASTAHLGDVPALTALRSTDSEPPARDTTRFPSAWTLFLEMGRCLVPPVTEETESERGASHPEWLVSFLESTRPELEVAPRQNIGTLRASTIATLPLAATLAVALSAIGVSGTLILVVVIVLAVVSNLALCILFYRRRSEVKRALSMRRRQREIRRRIASATRQRDALERAISDTREDDRRAFEAQRAQRASLESNLESKTAVLAQRLANELRAIDEKLAHDERVEHDMLASLLSAQQDRYASEFRRKARARSARLPGIDWREKCRLWTMGIWSAADVSAERLRSPRGIRDSTVLALVNWRIEVERGVRRSLPLTATGPAAERIRRQHDRRRVELLQRRNEEELRAAESLQALRDEYAGGSTRIDQDALAALETNEEARSHIQQSLSDSVEQELAGRPENDTVTLDSGDTVVYTFADYVRFVYLPWASRRGGAMRELD